MRKLFVDLGCREGNAVAAFLGDPKPPFGGIFLPRTDADQYEIYGFESPLYPHLGDTSDRFPRVNFRLFPVLAWVYQGTAPFLSDGVSELSRIDQENGWPQVPGGIIQQVPCIDFSAWLMGKSADWVVVKIDIEGAEYQLLKHLCETGAIDRINELYVEYHAWGPAQMRGSVELPIWERVERNLLYYRNDWP